MKEDTRFTLRIDTELFEEVKRLAELHKRSAAKEIEYILEEFIKSTKEKNTDQYTERRD